MLKRRALPSCDELNGLFRHDEEGGILYWKSRPETSFNDIRSWKIWNTRYAGTRAGSPDPEGAIVIRIYGITYFAHRLIWKMKTGDEPDYLDHRDLDPSNNRFGNLRVAEHAQNLFNVAGHENTVSGFKNVYFDRNCRSRPWKANVSKAGKHYSGGYFATKEEAFAAACALRNKLHGEFVRHGYEQP